MPQEFHVLLCYKCDTFQVDIIKKSKKWTCKLCGEKQSNKRVFGIGTSKDCRIHVQNLNKRKDLKYPKCLTDMNANGDIKHIIHSDISTNLDSENRTKNESSLVINKWSKFLDDSNCQTFKSEDQSISLSPDEQHESLCKFKSDKSFTHQDVAFDKRNVRSKRYDNISSIGQTVNKTDTLFEESNVHCSPSKDFNTFDLKTNNQWLKYLDENDEESSRTSEENDYDKNTKSRIDKMKSVFSNSGIFQCERENKRENENYSIKTNIQGLSRDHYKTACIKNKAHNSAYVTMGSIDFLKNGTEINASKKLDGQIKKMFFDDSDHCDLDEIFKM